MRITFLSNVHPHVLAPRKGTFNGALTSALGRDHDVQVVCPVSWIDRLQSRLGHSSSLPQRERTQQICPTFWYPPKVLHARFHQFLWWSLSGAAFQQIKAFQPDALLSYWAHPDGTVAVKIAQKLGIPAITMVGGSDILLLARCRRRRRVILETLRQSAAVIAVSRDIGERLVADGIDAGKVHVVRRGIDVSLFHPGDQAASRNRLHQASQLLSQPSSQVASQQLSQGPLIVGVGRLVPVKDWRTLVSACHELHRAGRTFQCVIVGEGPLRRVLQNQIDQLGLQSVVRLAGDRPQSELADWYRAADVVALSSLSEGIPNVLLESMACGTPFVATNVGGVPEIADPLVHRLVPAGQPAAMALALNDRLRMRSDLQPRIQPLSWLESAAKVAEIIRACVTRGGRAFPESSEHSDLREIAARAADQQSSVVMGGSSR